MGLYMKKNNQLVALAGIGDDVIPCGTIIASAASTAPDGFLPCDGTDTTGTTNELSTHYPILYSLLGNSNVLPAQFNHSMLSEWEDITLPTTAATAITMQYDGFIYVDGRVTANQTGTWVYLYVNGKVFRDRVDTSAFNDNAPSLTIPVKKGDVVYLEGQYIQTKRAAFYKQPLYIKATASAPTGIDVNAWKQYISSWVDITSDWSLPYSSAGTPTLEKVLWRPSTKELKVIVDATGISVSSNGSWAIVAVYDGTDPDIVAMKDAPFEHAASIQETNPRETYATTFIPGPISFGTTNTEFYATVRNVSSSSASLQHIVYHITL